MTSGERAVWAAEFVRRRPETVEQARHAAIRATDLVAILRSAVRPSSEGDEISADALAMLDDMTGVPR